MRAAHEGLHRDTHEGLYRDAYERDSCGFGLIANLDDRPSHWLVQTAIISLNRLTHRGAVAADGKTGDGCGLLLKRPDGFLRAVARRSGDQARRPRTPRDWCFSAATLHWRMARATNSAAQLHRQGL